MTESPLSPWPGHVVEVDRLPECFVCLQPATWDCVTRVRGSWGNLCDLHQPEFGLYPGQTGVGIGQRLILPVPEPAPGTVGALLASKQPPRDESDSGWGYLPDHIAMIKLYPDAEEDDRV